LYITVLYSNAFFYVLFAIGIYGSAHEKLAISESTRYIFFLLWLLCVVLFIFVSVINIFNSIKLLRNKEELKLRKSMMYIKFGAIPFFIINFIVLTACTLILIGASRGVGIIFVPIPVFFTYALLLSTSIYSVSYLIHLKNEKKIESNIFLIHLVLQFCFVLDVISVIVLLKNTGKLRRN
jgi:hypothetical protein